MVKNKAVYVVSGVTRDGQREVLGLWIAENEGAKFWLAGRGDQTSGNGTVATQGAVMVNVTLPEKLS